VTPVHVRDPGKPVLFATGRGLWWHRYGYPAAILGILALLAARLPSHDLMRVVEIAALPAVIAIALQAMYAGRLRETFATEQGIAVRQRDGEVFLPWMDLDWATEIMMKPPTLCVRVKRGIPGAPDWFLTVPPRARASRFRPQPMSEFVAAHIRETRAAHPERQLDYSPWPSRAGLSFKVQGLILFAFLAALLLSLWFAGILPFHAPPGNGSPISV
jgi:hypothetical protein